MLFHVEQRRENKFGTEPERASIHHLGAVFFDQVILRPEETYSPFNTLWVFFTVYVWSRFSLHFKKIVTNWINRHWIFQRLENLVVVVKFLIHLWILGSYGRRLLCPWAFTRQEYWRGLPCPPPGDLPNPGIEPVSPAFQAGSLPSEPPGKPQGGFIYKGRQQE